VNSAALPLWPSFRKSDSHIRCLIGKNFKTTYRFQDIDWEGCPGKKFTSFGEELVHTVKNGWMSLRTGKYFVSPVQYYWLPITATDLHLPFSDFPATINSVGSCSQQQIIPLNTLRQQAPTVFEDQIQNVNAVPQFGNICGGNQNVHISKDTMQQLLEASKATIQQLHEELNELRKEKQQLETQLAEEKRKVCGFEKETAVDTFARVLNQHILQNMDEEQLSTLERSLLNHISQVHDRHNELRSNQDLCCICLKAKKAVVFLPCRHHCTCRECSNRVLTTDDKCPLCQGKIEQRIEPF